MGTAPACAREALDMIRAGLGYLAAADAAQLAAATQAECLRELEQTDAIATAARASILAGFTAGQGYTDDAAYSARSWLIHQTHVTSGAAVGHTAWARRAATHPRVLAALAAGQVSASVGRLICLWTDRLPEKFRDESDELLVAAQAGLGVEELAALSAQMYERARSELPDQDPGRDLADRGVKLATTFGGAGVLHGDLTAECAEVLGRVLDALAPRPGRTMTGPGTSGTTTRWPRRCGGWWPVICCRSGPGSRSGRGCTCRWRTCCCSMVIRRCRSSGPRGCGSGGRRAGRSRPRPAARAAPGWTGTPPRASRATRRWPRW